MSKGLKRILKFIGYSLLTLVLSLAGFLGFMTLKDFRPEQVQSVNLVGNAKNEFHLRDTISVLTWNIGYAGLGVDQDFFFEEGKNVRPTQSDHSKYLEGIVASVQSWDSVDIIMLQEVDWKSKRSYFGNQVDRIRAAMPDYCSGYAFNYKSRFVPQPVSKPYGRCFSGILTLSRAKPAAANRYALAPDATWPTGLFMLKRCFMEFRYSLNNGKDLVVINTHMSAYDDGTVKQQQMDTLKNKILKEYAEGNYVIVGGDWNQYPPDYKAEIKHQGIIVEKSADKDYPEPGWTWAVDYSVTTNRLLYEPYKAGQTDEMLIDYYLLSPNVNLIQVKGMPLGFRNSDHNPVFLKVALN